MTDKRAITIIDDVNAYLVSRSIYENDSIAGYTYRVICEALTQLKLSALESSIHIPSGATNGDVIKAVFPKAISPYMLKGGSIYRRTGDEYIITSEFWNAPYREGDAE